MSSPSSITIQSQLASMTLIPVEEKRTLHPLKQRSSRKPTVVTSISSLQDVDSPDSPRRWSSSATVVATAVSPSARAHRGQHSHQHRRSTSDTSVLSTSGLSWSSSPSNSKPPLPSSRGGHRRQKSAPVLRSSSTSTPLDDLTLLTFGNIAIDPEVTKYEKAIQKLKVSCPPQSESDYQSHVAKIAKVYDALGNYHFERRAWQDAIRAFSQALSMFRVAHNGDMHKDPTIASTYLHLGNTYCKLGQQQQHDTAITNAPYYKEASKCMEQALRIRRVTRGSDDLETGAALHYYGQVLYLLGNKGQDSLQKAKQFLKEALEIRQDYCGQDDIGMDVACTMSLLGNVYMSLGDKEDALHMYIEALRQKVTFLETKQHSSVVASLVDIATLYCSMDGRLNDALDMYQQVLEIQSAICVEGRSSANYMDVGMTLHTLGNISRELEHKDNSSTDADVKTYLSRAAIMYKQAGLDRNHNCFVSLRQSMAQLKR